jgi:hypothetical protein
VRVKTLDERIALPYPLYGGTKLRRTVALGYGRGRYLTGGRLRGLPHHRGRQAFAGGLAFKLPFGTIYPSNITPDRENGIGSWSDAEFARAVRSGVGRHGEDLYPALPYTSYALMSSDDVLAIRALRRCRTSRLMACSPRARKNWHTDDQAKCCKQRQSGTCKPGFDLEASSRAAQTPFAEMLTVIGQQPIAVFPHTGSCSADDLSNVEIGWRVRFHPDALSVREMSERNFFHRPPAQTVREPRVVNDFASTDVDAVMQIAAPGCDKVRTQRGFLVPDQYIVACELPVR